MKKILAVITGIGYGHSIREAALLNHLKSKGYDIIVAGYDNSHEYFLRKFETLELSGMNFPQRKFKYSDFSVIFKNLFLPLKYLNNYRKLRKLCKIFNPDIIISDLEPIAFYLEKDKPHFFIFNFNPEIYEDYVKQYNQKFSFLSNIYKSIYKRAENSGYPVIVPSISVNKVRNNLHYVSPMIRALPKKTSLLRLHKDPIIISLGGSYFGSEILDKLLHILPKFRHDFIIFSYKTIGKSHDNIYFMPFQENFLEYLNESVGVITLGGHNTLAEAVVLKKPSLVFPVPNYIEQVLNGYELEKNGLGISKILKYPLEAHEIELALKDFFIKLPQLQESLNHSNIRANGAEQAARIIESKHTS